jgi:hypothetical protein
MNTVLANTLTAARPVASAKQSRTVRCNAEMVRFFE